MILWSAEWCMPCKALKPVIAKKYPFVEHMDVEVNSYCKPPEIKTVPTLQDGDTFLSGMEAIVVYLKNKEEFI